MKVFIDENGFLRSPYIIDANTEIEVNDETYSELCSFPYNHNWQYSNGKWNLVCLDDELEIRRRRQKECFNLIDNRSQLWYNHITEEQKAELNLWYEAWLDAPKTKIIPVKPEWL